MPNTKPTKTSFVKGDPRLINRIVSESTRLKRSESLKKLNPRISVVCSNCGKVKFVVKSVFRTLENHFCNRNCYQQWHKSLDENGYMGTFPLALKNKIRIRDNFTCQLCAKPESNEVHHIDYVKIHCDESNLITLCHNCHARTNHNKKHWIEVFEAIMIRKEITRINMEVLNSLPE